MNRIKKLLLVVLSIVMVITLAPVTAFASFNNSSVDASKVTDIKPISLGQKYDVVIDSVKSGLVSTKWFSFTPQEDDKYAFYSESEYETEVALYELVDNEYKRITDYSGIGTYSQLSMIYDLSAGKTYYYCVSMCDEVTGSFKVGIDRIKTIASISYDGDYIPAVSKFNQPAVCEMKITYTDNTTASCEAYIRYSDYAMVNNGEMVVGSYADKYDNRILFTMSEQDYEDFGEPQLRSYTAHAFVYEEDNSRNVKCDVSFDYVSFEDFYKGAPKLEVGTELVGNSPSETLMGVEPYILEVEEDADFALENLTHRMKTDNSYLIFYKKEADGLSEEISCNVLEPCRLTAGTYYVEFISYAKDVKFLFGYYNYDVNIPAKSISAPASLQMEVNTSKLLGARVLPETSCDELSYTSSNPKVVTVDPYGKLTAVAAGKATITITAGKKVAKCVVTVVSKQPAKPAVVKPGKVTKLVVKNSKKNTVSVKFNKAKNAKKYVIRYSTDKNFKKGVKTKTITKNSCLIKKLKKGKTYYFKVRAINGTAKGSYTRAKRVKIKK